jgi:hypothetical protein
VDETIGTGRFRALVPRFGVLFFRLVEKKGIKRPCLTLHHLRHPLRVVGLRACIDDVQPWLVQPVI